MRDARAWAEEGPEGEGPGDGGDLLGAVPDGPQGVLAEPRFEEAMSELESIVARLEGGDLTLDESLALFQRGIELARHCSRQLDEAERRVELLTLDEEGRPVLRPLAVPEEGP